LNSYDFNKKPTQPNPVQAASNNKKVKNKLGISLFALSLITLGAYSQTDNKKADTAKPAKEVIKDSGEKDLPRQLKENQLKQQPVILNADSSMNTSQAKTKKTKKNCRHKPK